MLFFALNDVSREMGLLPLRRVLQLDASWARGLRKGRGDVQNPVTTDKRSFQCSTRRKNRV